MRSVLVSAFLLAITISAFGQHQEREQESIWREQAEVSRMDGMISRWWTLSAVRTITRGVPPRLSFSIALAKLSSSELCLRGR
jgi:hypothetical protein